MLIIGLIIAAVSIIWSFFSLRGVEKSKISKKVKKELSKGRVVFHK